MKKSLIDPISSVEDVIVNSSSTPAKPTQTPSRKNHFFTWFYTSISEIAPVIERAKKICSKGTYQTEICPDTKKPHVHMMLWGIKKWRDTELKIPKQPDGKLAYWAKTLKDEANVSNYANKDDPSYDGLLRGSWGFPEEVMKITYDMLLPKQQEIANLFKEKEHPLWGRHIYWFWENKGNWGKSILATYMIDQMEALEVAGANADILCGINKMIEVRGGINPIIIFDVPRTNSNHVSYQAIEQIKNGKFFSPKYESGMCRFNKPHIVIFANEPPNLSMLSEDRWIVRELT